MKLKYGINDQYIERITIKISEYLDDIVVIKIWVLTLIIIFIMNFFKFIYFS